MGKVGPIFCFLFIYSIDIKLKEETHICYIKKFESILLNLFTETGRCRCILHVNFRSMKVFFQCFQILRVMNLR